MKTYDWIVVGGGITGAALGYELAKMGCSVLLVERDAVPQNATCYSYGGIAYWSGTTELTRQLYLEAIALHRNLSTELESDIQFRELDLLLTIAAGCEPEQMAASYADCAIPPKLLSVEQACEMEPLLNREAIAGALHTYHGHVDPELTTKAYHHAFIRAGGVVQIASVVKLIKIGDQVRGVTTANETYFGAGVVVCAGGLSRALLQTADIPLRLYFTHAELVETPPLELRLRSLVTSADLKRFSMEAIAGQAETDSLWDQPSHEVVPAILDAGVVQFLDGRLRMGQISRALTDPNADVNAAQSEAEIREGVGQLLPALKAVPGQWHHCLVGFSGDRLPLIGVLPNAEGIYIFSGFSNPFAILPPLARRFASHVTGQADGIVAQLAPDRFNSVA